MQITLEIPDHVLLPQQDKTSLAQLFKLHTALLLFQSGQLSRGAACEFADVDIYTFLSACKQHRIFFRFDCELANPVSFISCIRATIFCGLIPQIWQNF